MISNFCFFKEYSSEYSGSSILPTSLVMSSGTIPKSKITMSKNMCILCLSIYIAKLTSRKVVLNYLPILNSWVQHFPLILLLHIIYLFGYWWILPGQSLFCSVPLQKEALKHSIRAPKNLFTWTRFKDHAKKIDKALSFNFIDSKFNQHLQLPIPICNSPSLQ